MIANNNLMCYIASFVHLEKNWCIDYEKRSNRMLVKY